MLKSRLLKPRRAHRARVALLFGCVVFFASLPVALGQDFTLQAGVPNPSSVDPGVSSVSIITVGTINGFNSPVALSCAVVPLQTDGATCLIQQSATPPATAALTINTTSATPPTLYQITVTGTGPSTTHTTSVNVTVLPVTPEYTITVTIPMTPGSVHAGSGATAGITVSPINGYNGDVTLSCSAITPTATPSPVCSFDPATVSVTSSAVQTSTLTINTTGPATAISTPRVFYALWLPLPGLALIGACFGSRARRRKTLLGCLTLCLVAGVILIPACGSSNSTTGGSTSGVTPNNTYSFTLTGADANAIAPSNGNQTVTLTVN